MSEYKYDNTRAGAVLLSVEQERRRNAQLRIELEALTVEHAELVPRVDALRAKVEAARNEVGPKPRAKRGTGSSHGTSRKFDEGCRCAPCCADKKAKRQRYKANRAAREDAK